MKTLTTALCITLALFLCFACGEQKPQTVVVDPPVVQPKQPSTTDTISLQTFNTWTDNWLTHGKSFLTGSDTLLFFFTMPIVDLTEVIGEGPDQARYYLGLDMSIAPPEPHLILVGVDAQGNDMLNYNKGQYAYDVSLPCPPACFGGKPPVE